MDKEEKETTQTQPAKLRNHVILEWEAPARIYKRRGKDYFSTLAAIAFLIIVILAVFNELLLIGVVLTLIFFSYVLATVKPEKIKHQLTKKGVRVADNFYLWEVLTDFWVEEKHSDWVFHVAMPLRAPGRVIFLVENEETRDEIMEILSERLIYHEEPIKSWVDRCADWMTEKVQLDRA